MLFIETWVSHLFYGLDGLPKPSKARVWKFGRDNSCKLYLNQEDAMPKGQGTGSKETEVEQIFFLMS